MSDFVDTEKEHEIDIGGRKFKIREMGGYQRDELNSRSYIPDAETGKWRLDIAKRNECYLRFCVIDAPYDQKEVPFKSLNIDEKVAILQKLKPEIRKKLIEKIRKLNRMEEETAKNSKPQSLIKQ